MIKHGITSPTKEFCALYRDLGGELICFGSDAHSAKWVGYGIEDAAAAMRELSFKSQTIIRGGKLAQIDL